MLLASIAFAALVEVVGSPHVDGFVHADVFAASPTAPTSQPAGASQRTTHADSTLDLPPSSASLRFEDVEGVILIYATLAGATRDTSGLIVFDTGAGYLGIGIEVARALGVMSRDIAPGTIELAEQPLRRLTMASLELEQVSPMLVVDMKPVVQVTDRVVLGLAGTQLLTDRAAWIDYPTGRLVVLPSPAPTRDGAPQPGSAPQPSGDAFDDRVRRSRDAFGKLLGSRATPLAFTLAGDGKIMLRAALTSSSTANAASRDISKDASSVTLILDTGATKTVLFASELRRSVPEHRKWKSASGLTAPTLFGSVEAKLTLLPRLTIGSFGTASSSTVSRPDVDCIILDSELEDVLSRAVEQPVAGLLGYSFLRHFRVGLDFGNRIAWFEPNEAEWNPRPNEYVNVGLQLERRASAIEVAGVVQGSPADRAKIETGDRVLAIDGVSAAEMSVLDASRKLEGRDGTRVRLTTEREGRRRTATLVRRRIL